MICRPIPARILRGFSLLELMIAVVIVAILLTTAIPSYWEYVARGKRAAARTGLMEAAAFLERSFTTNGCYNRTTVATCQSQTGATLALPAALTRAPSDGRASYAIAVDFSGNANGQAYTLTATPCAAAGTCPAGSDAFNDTKCGALSITQAGVRGETGSEDLAFCWQR